MAFSLNGVVQLVSRAPTALFPIALGLAGLGAGLRASEGVFGVPAIGIVGAGLLIAAAIVLTIDTLLYVTKLLRNRAAVEADLSIAARANLLAPGFMAGVLIASALASVSPLGGPLWVVVTLGHLVLLIQFVGRWLTRDYAPTDLTPTWFLPAAGIMTSALSWPGYGPVALPAFTLATGATLWMMLLPPVFRRLVFEPAIAPAMRPSLFIVAAPFGLLANSLLTLVPSINPIVPAALACGGLFFIIVLLSQSRFLSAAGVSLGWWATTFPVATVATAFLRTSSALGEPALYTGSALLALACVTTALATVATVQTAWRSCFGQIDAMRDELAAIQGIEEQQKA